MCVNVELQNQIRIKFEDLPRAELVYDAIYEGGSTGNISDDVLSNLFEGIGNSGGFRICKKVADPDEIAYVILYTTGSEIEWPDIFDIYLGTFRYWGDNRTPGKDIHDTPKGGNKLLLEVFEKIDKSAEERKSIPPFLVFQKIGMKRNVKFLGLACPGRENSSLVEDLQAVWKHTNNQRFQNYRAYFTILNIGPDKIRRDWLQALRNGTDPVLYLAPKAWKNFVLNGRKGIHPLKSERLTKYRNKEEQLPNKREKLPLVNAIYNYFKEDPYAFEPCGAELAQMMDENIIDVDITRTHRDGGRDALAKYKIGIKDNNLLVECAMEMKCYSLENSCGVKETSRLISRIRHRQFGILVTTSYIAGQAYKEIVEDEHPILIISAGDIAEILIKHGYNSVEKVKEWLKKFPQIRNA
ncbi:MAG: restriction endonuclease [Candidatus Lokiarchaeota archaeon]|nr:restriction endonuclease [Candidatus Lokiarchaeota archaeon]